MHKVLAVSLSLVIAQALAVAAAEPARESKRFEADNKAIGTWKQVMKGKILPTSDELTTAETTLVSRLVVDGWYIETSGDANASTSKTLTALDADGTTVRNWMFLQGNVVVLAGKTDGDSTELTGTDQFGNNVLLTDKWINNDHREGKFVVKAKDGTVLIDVSQTLSRIGK